MLKSKESCMRSFSITSGNSIAKKYRFYRELAKKFEELIDLSLKLEKPAAELIILRKIQLFNQLVLLVGLF